MNFLTNPIICCMCVSAASVVNVCEWYLCVDVCVNACECGSECVSDVRSMCV